MKGEGIFHPLGVGLVNPCLKPLAASNRLKQRKEIKVSREQGTPVRPGPGGTLQERNPTWGPRKGNLGSPNLGSQAREVQLHPSQGSHCPPGL